MTGIFGDQTQQEKQAHHSSASGIVFASGESVKKVNMTHTINPSRLFGGNIALPNVNDL